MKHLSLCVLTLLGLTSGDLSASSPWRVTTFLQNEFTVLCAWDSLLIAAGDNGVAGAVFDRTSRQFVPGTFEAYSGPAVRIRRQGQLAVIQSAAGSLSFFDASALPSLVLLGTVHPTNDYQDFAVEGNRLFLACGFDGVRQYELSSYSDMIFIDSSLVPVHAVALTISQERLYVVDDYTGVLVFGPTNTPLGNPLDFIPLATPATSIAVRNDTAFVGSVDDGIFVVTNQSDSLIVLDTLAGLFSSSRIELADTLLLSISSDGERGELFSLHGHYNPMVASFGTTFHGGSVFLVGGRAYFVTPALSGELSLYDLDNIEQDLLQPRSANPYGGEVTDVCIFNDKVIVSRKAHPTLSYESQVVNPSPLGLPVVPGLGGVDQLETARDRLLLYSQAQQTVAFVSANGPNFQLTSVVGPFADDITGFRVTESLFDSLNLLCLFGAVTIDVSTISPSWQIAPIARLYFPERPTDIAVIDTLIIVGSAENVYVYSLNTDFVMTYRSTITLSASGSAFGPLVRLLTNEQNGPSTLWIVRTNGIEQYNFVNPASPLPCAQLEITGGISDASKGGDYIYASSPDGGLLRIYSPASSSPAVTDSIRLIGNLVGASGSSVALASQHAVWLVDWDAPSAVDEEADVSVPVAFELEQNYPNPFNPMTTIEFTLTQPSPVNLTVYNLLGQLVRQLANYRTAAGKHRVVFDATDLSSGVYFYRLTTDVGTKSKKMVVVK